MNKPGAVLITLLLALTCQTAWAGLDKKTITFAVDPNYPPLEYLDSGGRMVGFSIDYFQAVCREAGLTAEFINGVIDWDNLSGGLDQQDYDAILSSVTINQERRRKMDFTIPYYVVRQSLLVRPDSSLSSILELKDHSVGTQAGTTATMTVEKIPGVISRPYPEIGEAIAALAKGELDAVVCEDVVGAAFQADPAYAGKIKTAAVINTPGAEELYAVAVRKGNLDVLIALNDGIKAVKAKGLDDELRRKWFK